MMAVNEVDDTTSEVCGLSLSRWCDWDADCEDELLSSTNLV